MACFLVPAAEAVVVEIVKKVQESKAESGETAVEEAVTFDDKLGWLFKMLIHNKC